MADGPQLGTAYLRVAGDFSHINTQAVGLFKSSQWAKYGKLAGAGIVTGLAAAGIAKALFDIGSEFDTAFDKIRTQSGATGKELGKLEGSFKKVVSSVPTDFGSAADAIAGLNQRLGLTGKPLNQLAKQLTALSKITDTEVSSNVQSVTRLFGDWSVKTQKQTDTLDKLFRLTQDTGITIGDLSDSMVQFGSPLRQLGFHFDQAAAMFAAFEQQGVNTQTLLPGLRFAIKAFSGGVAATTVDLKKWGISLKDPAQGLQQVMALIKDAPTDLKANAIAFEVFGQRAGPDMAAAIREGRFQLDDLIKGMSSGNETIRGTERQTRDFSEQWTLFANRMKVFVEPIATTVFKLLGDGMRELNLLFSGKGKFAEGVKSIIADLKEFWDQAGVVRAAVGALAAVAKTAWSAITAVFRAGAKIIKGVVETISGVLTGDFGRAWQGVKDIFSGAIHGVIGLVKGMFAPIITAAKAIGGALGDIFGGAWDKVTGIFKDAAGVLKDIVNWIISNVINRIPGVEIGIIGGSSPSSGADAASGPTGGGHSNPAHHYSGGKITRPTAIVGEEAPRHPEYVLATNPAYRDRNLKLWRQAGGELGIPGFARGGVNTVSPIGQAVGTVTGSAGGFIDKMSGAPFGLLPGFMEGTGTFIRDKFAAYIKDKVTSAAQAVAGAAGVTSTAFSGPPADARQLGNNAYVDAHTLAVTAYLDRKFGLTMTSGYRSPAHNAAIGGAVGSLHTHGTPANPGATDSVGPMSAMESYVLYARQHVAGLIEAMVDNVGNGWNAHLGFFAKGGRIGKGLPGQGQGGGSHQWAWSLLNAIANHRNNPDKYIRRWNRLPDATRSALWYPASEMFGGKNWTVFEDGAIQHGSNLQQLATGGVIGRAIPKDLQKFNHLWSGASQMPVSSIAELAEYFGMPGVAMAQIARGESTYEPGAVSSDGGYGLWQITRGASGMDSVVNRMGGYPAMLNPIANAIIAGKMYASRGLSPWVGTRYLTDPSAHWTGAMADAVRAGASGGGSGGSTGSSGPKETGVVGPPLPHGAQTITGISDAMQRLLDAIQKLRAKQPRLQERLDTAQTLDAFLSSPSGSDLSAGERAGEVGLATNVLNALVSRAALIKKWVHLMPKHKITGRLAKELVGLQGITGTSGEILTARSTLDALGVSSTSTAFDTSDLYKQLYEGQLATTLLYRAQLPTLLKMAPYAGSFGGGGTVPGPIGAPRTAIVHGGEQIGGSPNITFVFEEGCGIDESKIRTVFDDHVAAQVRSGNRMKIIPGQKVGA